MKYEILYMFKDAEPGTEWKRWGKPFSSEEQASEEAARLEKKYDYIWWSVSEPVQAEKVS